MLLIESACFKDMGIQFQSTGAAAAKNLLPYDVDVFTKQSKFSVRRVQFNKSRKK